MKILGLRVMRGPNYWSTYRKQLIVMNLDLEEAEQTPTDKIDGFAERIEALLPSLYAHRCSPGKPGGLFERIRRGTWLGHVIEHVALELQTMAGMHCGFGRTRNAGNKGTYHVVFSYIIESAGLYAAKAAVDLVEALKNNQPYDLQHDIDQLKRIHQREGIGPSTQSILNAAKKKGIPFRMLEDNMVFMLGQGKNQKLINATIASTTSDMGVDIAAHKERTKKMLRKNYIPVPDGVSCYDVEGLEAAISKFGFPLVLKPLNANHGRGITTNIQSLDEAARAFEKAKEFSRQVIVERFIKGMDYRFLVINYKLEAVARRTPAYVMGDGKSTIQQLIDKTNEDPCRGDGHENILTKIKVDALTSAILINKGLDLASILPDNEILFLKDTANLSTGGTARDVTDMVHPSNVFMAERIARLMNLDICGIDVMAEDITKPISKNNGAVIEVNAAPGFRMHLSPSKGTARNVGEPVVRMLFPDGASSRIPIVAVTGTNGKTTTTRLIAHIAKQAEYCVGFTTTDGIYIQDQLIVSGDCSGPSSAEVVLRDPSVDFAVLECARGGILRAGLAFDKCNISVITNITEDHIGLKDIHTVEEMAKVKSVVARSTFDDGYTILNADDDLVYAMRKEVDCNVALFSMREDNPRVIEHCQDGGWAAIVEKGFFTICQGEWRIRVAKVNEVPLTFEGRASCMIKNILPSILAATISDISIKTIRLALQSFIPGPEHTPGRMNIFRFNDYEIMLDYFHNTDGFDEMKLFMEKNDSPHKIGIIACSGDRRDDDIRYMGKVSAEIFDEIIIRHDKDGRGRSNEMLTQLITEGIEMVKPGMNIKIISNETDAIDQATQSAPKGTFIVVACEKIHESIQYLKMMLKQESPSMAYEL